MNHFLEVQNITKEYGDYPNIIHAVRETSFYIEKGSFTAITGKSGSGKTTLLKLIGGLIEPTSGEIWINGANISQMDEEKRTIYRRSHIGYVFQEYNLIPSLTVIDNLILPSQLNGDKIDENLFHEITQILELDTRLDAMPHMLSGGQQQRVAIGRALLMKPEVILADEPTGNLDSITEEKVLSLMQETSKQFHQTLIMITHNHEITKFADRRLHIEDGKILVP